MDDVDGDDAGGGVLDQLQFVGESVGETETQRVAVI